MKNIIKWFLSSNRYKHLLLGFAYGLFANSWYSAIYGGLGVSLALEWKDGQWGGKPDLIDALLTFIGVILGYIVRQLF